MRTIPIIDENLPISATDEEVRVTRKTIDECFDYIVQTIDEAIIDLPIRVLNSNDLGRIDQVIAKSIKSRVLLYAASPLFNGNFEMYSDFINENGQHYFNQSYDALKWELARDASLDAIDAALDSGVSLYQFISAPPSFDTQNFQYEFIRKQYDVKYSIVDRWNSELIWGNSDPVTGNDWWQMQAGCMMKNPNSSSVEAAWQWIAPTLRSAELFYTKNGLPIDEDLTFDYSNRFNTANVSSLQNLQAQYGNKTAILNLDREPRFYSSLAFDRGYNRTWGSFWNLRMRKGEIHGRIANSNDYLITGYALKKLVHPDSEGDGYSKIVTYSWPMIRFAEVYLNYAEALNEINGPSQEAYNALNFIRDRAGIKSIEEAWDEWVSELPEGAPKIPNLNNASGVIDGWTQCVWSTTTNQDTMALHPPGQEWFKPTIGHLWIFPNWLHHQVYPFFGPGERLSIAMNWNVHDSDEQLLLGKSEEQKQEFYAFQEDRKKEKEILDKAKEDGFWEK